MSNVISELRRAVQKDGFAAIDRSTFDELQAQWIRRALGEEILEAMKQDLAVADARAGKAERLLASEQEGSRARASWLKKAKQDAGYDPNVSFDVVWEEALAALKEKRSRARQE